GVNCNSQPKLENRQPSAAGRFYPSDIKELKSMLEDCFNNAVKNKHSGEVLAVISPHAGYVFSGTVAASAFNQIDPDKEYENIFIIGASHSTMLKGASIYNVGNYITPLGEVKVNTDLATKLIEKYDVFEYNKSADANEHSIEVQIPFLQYIMKKDFQIVPIVVGAYNLSASQKIADALQPYFNERNLFVISTDFSHYPDYNDAKIVDKETAEAIQSNSVEDVLKVLTAHEQKGIKNLSTSICGWPAVFTLLFMTQNYPEVSINEIQYINS
ncbi:MAG: AmmeMemoRadiSam system protein B, partial [Ignavibacteria bacterium RBG_13_36_8]